jgi:hypothetical protein
MLPKERHKRLHHLKHVFTHKIVLFSLGAYVFALTLFAIRIFFFSSPASGPFKSPAADTAVKVASFTHVPEPNDKPEQDNIAVPLDTYYEPNTASASRTFEISAENDGFLPNNIIVYQNDIVTLVIKANDKEYDFVIPKLNIYKTLSKGNSAIAQFQAALEGKHPFYCTTCAQKDTPKGYLTVVSNTKAKSLTNTFLALYDGNGK